MDQPFYVFTHHKCGTTLMSRVFREISSIIGVPFFLMRGWQPILPNEEGIFLVAHSLTDVRDIYWPYKGLHVVRDPRNIVVSGYLYHKKTSEEWCINQNFSVGDLNQYPQIPYSQLHRSEGWKCQYFYDLQGKSYQANLLAMNQNDGLLFEMDHYAKWTIESISNWYYEDPNILELRLEMIMSDYPGSWRKILMLFDLSEKIFDKCLISTGKHDLSKKSTLEVSNMEDVNLVHEHGWKDYFDPVHKRHFKEMFGNILTKLGYEESEEW